MDSFLVYFLNISVYIIVVFYVLLIFIRRLLVMHEISYKVFVEDSFYSDFEISFMPGLKVMYTDIARCLINVDAKTAYVFIE
jgi:hypothetical protein